MRGPRLPTNLGIEWHPQTVRWWETWRKSAQASSFTATDWDFLLDTAGLHHSMWSELNWSFAAEIRLRVAKFGATPEDRARLRIEIETPAAARAKAKAAAAATTGTVTPIDARRARVRSG